MSILEYAEKFVVLPPAYTPPGPFKLGLSRYLVGPWEALQDPKVKMVTVLKATQTGGSLVGDIWLAWLMRVAPAPMFFNMQTDDDAKDHATLRINELLNRCKPVADILPEGHKGKHAKRVAQAITTQAMWLIVQGANMSNLQSKSVCYVMNDEVVFWNPDSLIRDSRARQTAFGWRKKEYDCSQGGMDGDEHDRSWRAGTMEKWSWSCSDCGMIQPYKWSYNNNPKEQGGIKWEKNETTCPEGNYVFEEIAKTVRMQCRGCGEKIEDTPKNRKILAHNSKYVKGNFTAPESKRSFHWNALACEAIPWADIVWEWLTEVIPEYRTGNRDPLQKFIQKKLAESDDEGVNWFDAQTIQNSDYSFEESGDAPEWEEERTRFMAIDKQIDHYWWVVRAFSASGTSRLVAWGKAFSDYECEVTREKYGVQFDHTVIDSGAWATEVYMACCVYGWRCMKGEADRSFPWKDEDGETVMKPFSEPIKREPLFGMKKNDFNSDEVSAFQSTRRYKNAILCRWSNAFIKDLLQNLRAGNGLYWGIPANVGQTYTDQLNGEQRRMKTAANGKRTWTWVKVGRAGDHLRDCECMILVLAAMRGLLVGRKK